MYIYFSVLYFAPWELFGKCVRNKYVGTLVKRVAQAEVPYLKGKCIAHVVWNYRFFEENDGNLPNQKYQTYSYKQSASVALFKTWIYYWLRLMSRRCGMFFSFNHVLRHNDWCSLIGYWRFVFCSVNEPSVYWRSHITVRYMIWRIIDQREGTYRTITIIIVHLVTPGASLCTCSSHELL